MALLVGVKPAEVDDPFTFQLGFHAACNATTVVTEEDVRQIALSLPGAYERQSYGGRPSWRTQPRMFTWIRDEPDALVVWVESLEDKEALIASDPAKFFTTPHYNGQPITLVCLDAVNLDEVKELIVDSWRVRAPRALTTRGAAIGSEACRKRNPNAPPGPPAAASRAGGRRGVP
jgi:hypothetical protein